MDPQIKTEILRNLIDLIPAYERKFIRAAKLLPEFRSEIGVVEIGLTFET